MLLPLAVAGLLFRLTAHEPFVYGQTERVHTSDVCAAVMRTMSEKKKHSSLILQEVFPLHMAATITKSHLCIVDDKPICLVETHFISLNEFK